MIKKKQRGVSLVEALVAMAVMAFGMLGVAAIQGGLRQNIDITRQRAEAVRLAQESIERLRGYSVIPTSAVKRAYDDIVTPAAAESIVGSNATYTRTITVTTSAPFNVKSVQVVVDWTDRSNAPQRVMLASQIHRVPPELNGSIIVPASQLHNDGGRSGNQGGTDLRLPFGSTDNGDGTSTFSIPGAGGRRWIFDNASGLIVRNCSDATAASCASTFSRLIQGYVSFALNPTAEPTPAEAENPPSATPSGLLSSISVTIAQTAPTGAGAMDCYYEQLPASPAVTRVVGYFCAVQVTDASGTNSVWSGGTSLALPDLATSATSVDPMQYRVCRYTRYRNDLLVGATQSETGLVLTNFDHPKVYKDVGTNLLNQNFLIIRGGNGALPFACPDDDASTLEVYGRTHLHQP